MGTDFELGLDKDEHVHIRVNDIMSKPVITAHINDKVNTIAAVMRVKKVGSVVVSDVYSNPVGVITERDIVERIVSKDRRPSEVDAEEIMSKPLNTVRSDATITEASKAMRNLGVRRLVVVKGSKPVGIISSDDIVKIIPELITIISGESRIGGAHPIPTKAGLAGRCDSCDQWSNNLNEQEGLFLCEECLSESK